MDSEMNSTALQTEELAQDVEMQQEQADFSNMNLKELVQSFESLLEKDQQERYKYADLIKAQFYKRLKAERIENGLFSNDAESTTDESGEVVTNDPFAELERGFKELYNKYRVEKISYMTEQEKVREENYAAKLVIIEEIKALLEKAEDVNHTFPAFRELQNRWRSIDMVPQAKAKDLWDRYQHYVEKFYDFIKINNEFRDLDFKKNLEAKTVLCAKAEALEQHPNVVSAFKELQKLHEEWKEIGPVAKEFREQIWDRFKVATSAINKKHQKFFDNLKEEQKGNLEAKVLLCQKAEEIADAQVTESNEWNRLSKKMDELQAKWKNIGFASRKDNQKIYDRFRSACDKFYTAKREYYANFKNVMLENLKKKEELCMQAEALMHSEDWKKATDQLINLQKLWKEVGPVARKQSEIVWKRFRTACDHFFENKASHFDKVDEKFEDNLSAKLALIEAIKSYELSDSVESNVAAMREFFAKWNEIGFVPFKEKEKVQKAFNEAMDSKFADIRSLETEKKLNKFRKMVADVKSSGKGDRGLRMEREKLIVKYRKLEQDIATLENNKGFFAKSKNASAFITDIDKKIFAAKEELMKIEEKIKIIEKQFE